MNRVRSVILGTAIGAASIFAAEVRDGSDRSFSSASNGVVFANIEVAYENDGTSSSIATIQAELDEICK